MRSEAVHRLILNLSIFPGMKSEVSDAKFVRFSGTELGDGGKPQVRAFMIRVSSMVPEPIVPCCCTAY
jgi:hypothetical protein